MTHKQYNTSKLIAFTPLLLVVIFAWAASENHAVADTDSDTGDIHTAADSGDFAADSGDLPTKANGLAAATDNDEFRSLFNGEDFTGWIVPEGDGGHWQVIDGVIDYDALSEAPDDKNLWTEEEFEDFVLRLDWKIKETPFINPNVRIILPDGSHKKDESGEDILISVPDSDSGVYLRGMPKAQINIWSWPVGSGEVYGYRMDQDMPAEVRAGVTPDLHADNHIGEWNTFEITMQGDRLTVVLNGHTVIENVQLPGIDSRGQIALQHHGSKRDGEWVSSPSLVQFRNIYIREL